MADTYPSPNEQKQLALQKRHKERLQMLATHARVLRQEAKQKAEANEAKREAVLLKSEEGK
jgi:hypothetical protein